MDPADDDGVQLFGMVEVIDDFTMVGQALTGCWGNVLT